MASSSRASQGGLPARADAWIGAAGAVVGMAALALGPFVSFRPNRIVAGDAASAIQALGWWGYAALALWALAGAIAVVPLVSGTGTRGAQPMAVPLRAAVGRWSGPARAVLATATLTLLLSETGRSAAAFAAGEGDAARTSFGWCFYAFLFALYLVLHSASSDTGYVAGRVGAWLLPLLAVVALASTGRLTELGIVREWELTSSTFTRELVRHLFYALGATIGAVVIGVPLGLVCARSRRAEAVIMGALNLGQVLPALAFVGIMIPILASLSSRLAVLKALGISGIGWAPVMVVLLVYALFPVTRNTLVAIRQLDPGVLDTAKGMGMGRWRSLREVELPLAFPVVLAGVRIALVQSTAGAILAAFVGGGGLGTIMFLGLEQTSMDLVLVGVVPIVVLALFFDALLRGVEYVASGGRVREPALSAA